MSKQKIITGIKLIEGALKNTGAKEDNIGSIMNNFTHGFSPDLKEKIQSIIIIRDKSENETFSLSKQALSEFQDLCFEVYAALIQLETVDTSKKEEPAVANTLLQDMAIIKDIFNAGEHENQPYYSTEFKWFLKGLFDTSADHFVNAFDEIEEERLKRRKIVDEKTRKLNIEVGV